MPSFIPSFLRIGQSFLFVVSTALFLQIVATEQSSAADVSVVGWYTKSGCGASPGYEIAGGKLIYRGIVFPPYTCETITKGYYTYSCNEDVGYYEYVSGTRMNGQPITANDGSMLNIADIDVTNDEELQPALDGFYGACEGQPCPKGNLSADVRVVGWYTKTGCGASPGYDIRCGELAYFGIYSPPPTCETVTKGYFTYRCNENTGDYEHISGTRMNGQPIRINDKSLLNIANIDINDNDELQAALDGFYGKCEKIIEPANRGGQCPIN